MNPASRDSARDHQLEAILHAYLQAVDAGHALPRDDLLLQHPDFASELAAFFADQDAVGQLAQGMADPAMHVPRVADVPTTAPVEASMPPGTQLRYFGDYELLQEIARGGMGVVYRARQVSLNRLVAIKMILAGQLASPSEVQRFHAEAQIAANLQHPNIVAIYEVGQHEGQHYFSMALVEGQSLAELIRENTLPPDRAVRYVKIVSEAIQFAHEQGTLHRDLKPSNILIDGFDQPQVTDFGLARRTQVDARLTATGAVLGTPSYLPPEQASGERGKVGPASDVYSLGAMLYELVTGRPPFRAATAIDTILMVLSTAPVAPRLLNPKLDRNLETMILKCLAKEPADRYASAGDLADDLQAHLEGRPIKARRAGRLERGRRWLRKHRRTLTLTAATAAVTALLLVGGILAWWHSRPKPGHILLTTAGEPLTAEALDDDDQPMAPRFTVPTAEPQLVPTGCYSFRFTAPGRCSETYRTFVDAEFTAQGHVTLEDRRLWEPIPVAPGETADVVKFGDHADVVLAGPHCIRRLDGVTGKLVWKQPFEGTSEHTIAQMRKFALPPEVRLTWSTVDLNGDGIVDLVWAKPATASAIPREDPPWILAVSGKTGEVLWYYDVQKEQPKKGWSHTFLFGAPAVAKGNGEAAFVMTYRFIDGTRIGPPATSRAEWKGAVQVEAISNTGKLLWRSAVKKWTTDQTHAFLPAEGALAAHVLHLGQRDIVAVVAENTIATFDLKTGQPVYEKQELPKPVTGVPQFIDGEDPGVLLVDKEAYVLRSLRSGKELWRKSLPADRPPEPEPGQPSWPLIADLGGDGKQSLILLRGAKSGEGARESLGVELVDAVTGKTRWTQDLGRTTSRSRYLVLGPDIDGDGHREIFAAWIGGRSGDPNPTSAVLQVEALSGRDGHVLWTHQQPAPRGFNRIAQIGPLLWWQKDEESWPLLVVSQTTAGSANAAKVIILSASTGRLRHVLPEFGSPGVADFNGDGIPDLYAIRGGKLHSLAGQPGEAWRWMQGHWKPLRVRDGIATELVTPWLNRRLFFISAANGLLQRRTDLGYVQQRLPVADGADLDLDGDGVEDLLFLSAESANEKLLFVKAISGRSGKVLWRSNLRIPQTQFLDFHYSMCQDLDGDGQPEVVCVYSTDKAFGAFRRNYTLAVLSGGDGKIRWEQRLVDEAEPREMSIGARFVPGIGDLDGDGVKDVVAWALTPDLEHEIRAFSGVDGHLLWSHALDSAQEAGWREASFGLPQELVVTVGDLDGDGKPTVIVQCPDQDRQGKKSCEILVLEGRDGKTRWSRRLPAKPSGNMADPTPFLVAGADGCRIAVLTVDPASKDQAQVVILDRTGKECGRASVAIPGPHGTFPWNASVRPLPQNRLLLVASGKLRLSQGGVEKTCWTWPIPGGSGVMVDVLPARKEKTETIVVQAGTQVYGVDSGTSKTIWTCMGPGRCTHVLPASGLPYVLFEVTDPKNAANVNTMCRRAIAK